MAQTLTSKLKLAKHDTGDLNWGADANANMDALDAHAQQALLRPPRTLSATLGSGAVGANLLGNITYFYKVTAVNAVGETTEGQIPAVVEAQVTQPATPLPVILQWETVSGATGYKIYKATASGQEQFLAQVSGGAISTYTDTGNTATTATSVPAANTARTSVSQIIAGANVTVSPPDGTGAVTVSAAGAAAPPNASATVAGVTELSVAPANPSTPIAVGINDPSVTNARTPSGTAGGDLSGTYPNPSVAKINGTSVPAAPSAGQVLTATGPTAAAWQAPAAAGGGYATVVVAAPSGTAATDTTNIQNAINAAASAGGGVVELREGIYLISSTITPKSGVTLQGMGKSTGFNTGISGGGTGGAESGTTLKGTTGLGSTPMFSDSSGNANNITFRDLTIDYGFTNGRGTVSGGQSMVLHGSYVTFVNVSMLGNATQGNPDVDITPSNINDMGRNKFIGCDFYNGGAATTIAWQLDGEITSCYFEGTAATFSELLNIFSGSVTNCYFACNVVYNTGIIQIQPNNNGPSIVIISNCYFKQFSGTQTTAIFVNNITNGNVAITGNVAHSTAVGNIRVAASSGLRNVTGNVGFASYSGGNQNANDGQTALNSGAAAGGDLSGTLPNPSVAKVNGTSVPASPAAGQVLTATGPTAAAWQTPTAAPTPGYPSVLGTGADGAVVISANTALPSTNNFGPQANVAIKNYSSLTINSGAILSLAAGVNGMIIRCTGTVTINGTIDVSGQGAVSPSSGGTPGNPGGQVIAGGTPSPVLFPQLFGAATSGDVFNGNAGGPAIISGAGGAGSSGNSPASSHTPGNGGPAPSATAVALFKSLLASGYSMGVFLTGGSGGGNGNGGLLGGNGGGFVYIFAANIVIGSTGLIKANGSDGTTSGPIGLAGCGGGGGGIIVLAYQSLTNNGAVQANGGAGGGVDSVAGPAAGGTNTTIGGQPTAGTTMPSTTGYPTGGISTNAASGGGGSGGIIVGIQL